MCVRQLGEAVSFATVYHAELGLFKCTMWLRGEIIGDRARTYVVASLEIEANGTSAL